MPKTLNRLKPELDTDGHHNHVAVMNASQNGDYVHIDDLLDWLCDQSELTGEDIVLQLQRDLKIEPKLFDNKL